MKQELMETEKKSVVLKKEAIKKKKSIDIKKHLFYYKDPNGVVKYKCKLCKYETIHYHELKQHVIYNHMNPEQDLRFHKCPECDYKSRDKSNLNRHVKRHKNTKLKCDECNFMTLIKLRFEKHLLFHKDARNSKIFNCTDCEYKTFRKYNLVLHMLVHKNSSEVKMYKCELCDYESKRKNQIKQHTQSHARAHFNLGKKKPTQIKKSAAKIRPVETKNREGEVITEEKDVDSLVIKNEILDIKFEEDAMTNDSLEDSVGDNSLINGSIETKIHEALMTAEEQVTNHLKIKYESLDIKIEEGIQDTSNLSKKEESGKLPSSINNQITRVPSPDINLTSTPDTEYRCTQCTFQIGDKSSLEKHLLWHTTKIHGGFLKCDECQFETIDMEALKNHMCMYKCQICGFQARFKNLLKLHIMGHENRTRKRGMLIVKCNNCSYKTLLTSMPKTFDRQDTLLGYKCNRCKFRRK